MDQALALEPEAPAARALLDQLQASLRRGRARRRAWLVVGAAVAVAGLATVGVTVVRKQHRDPEPAAATGPARVEPLPATVGRSPPAPHPVPSPSSVATAASVVSPGSSPEPPRPVTPAPESPLAQRPEPGRPAAVRYQILVRPYGSVQVDDERKPSEPLSVHTLALSPGHHVLHVSCQWCEDQAVPVEVVAGRPETLAIPARLKPAQLRFAFEPPTAQVRVGDVTRAAEASLAQPFDIASPRAPTRFVHHVDYEVSAPGYRSVRSTVEVIPGATRTLAGRLVPE